MTALAIDPTAPRTLYTAATHTSLAANAVFKSTDGGESWQAANDGLAALYATGTAVCGFAIDPTNTSTVYAASNGAGVFKSSNGGESWAAMNAGLDLDVALETGRTVFGLVVRAVALA